MTNKLLRCLALLALPLLYGGCFPYRFTDEPGAKGRVIDARTRAPIRGAKIELTGGFYQQPFPVRHATTGPDGTFLFQAKQYWGVWFLLPIDYFGWITNVDIAAAGHAPATRSFGSNATGPAITTLGDIPL